MNWYLNAIKGHYADFKGRARRQEFWMFFLFNAIVGVLFSCLGMILSAKWIGSIYELAVFVPTIAVTARRLHDIGKSGWMQCVALIPLVGWIWLLVLLCKDGMPEQNRWGANPKA